MNTDINKTLYQGSLFEEKGVFDQNDFHDKCITPKFITCVGDGIIQGMHKMVEICSNMSLCTRNKSALLHEQIALSIERQVNVRMSDEDILCHIDSSGNDRNIIMYNGYAFIFRKNLNCCNSTKQAMRVVNQELSRHILTITYSVDDFFSRITSIAVKYIQSNTSLYEYHLNIGNNEHTIISDEASADRKKITLKKELIEKLSKQA